MFGGNEPGAVSDPYLLAVVRSVEDGGDPVLVTLALTSGVVVVGFVRTSEFFVAMSRQQPHDAMLALTHVKKRKPETYEQANSHADHVTRMLHDVDTSESGALTLSDVKMVWDSGDGITLQTLRLNLDTVAAWWVGRTATPFKSVKDVGGFVGVAVPLG